MDVRLETPQSCLKSTNLSNDVFGLPQDRSVHKSLQTIRTHVQCLQRLLDDLLAQPESAWLSPQMTEEDFQLSQLPRRSSDMNLRQPGQVTVESEAIAESEMLGSASLMEENSQDPFTVEDRFLMAVDQGDTQSVRHMLRLGQDPNVVSGEREVRGLALTTCTPLAIAIIHQNGNMVRLLMEHNADPHQHYSFLAGASQMRWSGPVIQAMSPSGNLGLLKELVKLNADLHVAGSNGANLLWQAAYFGHAQVVQFLLDERVDKEAKAINQDNNNLSHTPLHMAAKCGHYCAVEALLKAHANIQVDDGESGTPLDDAVKQGHADIVELLISKKADVFCLSSDPVEWTASSHYPVHARCLDIVFRSNNHGLVAAVAKGLKEVRDPPLTRKDLITFLGTPGDSPMHIWESIFRPIPLRHWEERDEKRFRVVTHTAFMSPAVGMTTGLGPAPAALTAAFKKKETMPAGFHTFRSRMTRESHHHPKDLHVPVTFYACVLPYVQEDLEVILAMANCDQDKVFEVPGCRAILQLMWAHERTAARFRMVMAFIEVINLVLVNVILNTYTNLSPHWKEPFLSVALVLALVVWVVASLIEVMQCVGYGTHSLMLRYVMNKRHIFDTTVLALTGLVIGWTFVSGTSAPDFAGYRILLGFVVGLKWGRMLISLRQFKSVAIRILPILDTMWDLGPFLFVLSVYFIGAVNMLYALGQHTLTDAFLIVYRLVVMGDMNLYELEGQSMTMKLEGPDSFVQIANERTEFREVAYLMMLMISFVMGVSMMNLFVAMLCLSYSEAAKRAPMLFEKSRAHMVLDDYAARKGLIWTIRTLTLRHLRKRYRQAMDPRRLSTGTESTVLSTRPEHSVTSLKDLLRKTERDDDEAQHSHVWFSLPKRPI